METANSYSSVCAPYWDECWIVAGGPSTRSFLATNQEIWRARHILAVNSVIYLLKEHTHYRPILFSGDNNWVRAHRAFITYYEGEKYLALPLETFPDCGNIRGVRYLRWEHGDGLSENPDALNTGGNSGYMALNLAYLKQSKRIHLVGYDMNTPDNDQFLYWAAAFRTTLPQLKARGVEVLNHSPSSAIDAFPKE